MIVLDTNVVSELTRPRPSQPVIDWVDASDPVELAITAITAAEIRAAIAALPAGRRRREIERRMESLLAETFAGYVLPFDVDATPHYARILRVRNRAGRPISGLDAQIAAICVQHDAALATRNTADFAGLGLDLVDPWQGAQER